MRLLTVGTGKGAGIAEMFSKSGARVNNVNLFKTFAIVSSLDELKMLRHIDDGKKFYTVYRDGEVDIRSVFNNIISFNELFEASLVICDLSDDFSFYSSMRVGEELHATTEEPRICLSVSPELDSPEGVNLTFMRIKHLMKSFDFLFLFEKKYGYEDVILKTFNTLSLVGEIDVKKQMSGEVVVDTSDFVNSLSKDGISIAGITNEKLPMKILRRLKRVGMSETIAERTERMMRMFDMAVKNVGARADINSAKKGLIVFSGDPDEITMDGMFECIKSMERINPAMMVRYGDYPVPNSNELNAVVVFSGIKKFRL